MERDEAGEVGSFSSVGCGWEGWEGSVVMGIGEDILNAAVDGVGGSCGI
jgi:hypothetical protein